MEGEPKLGNSRTPNLLYPSDQWMVVSDQVTEDSGLEVMLPFSDPSIALPGKDSANTLPASCTKQVNQVDSYLPFPTQFFHLSYAPGWVGCPLCSHRAP